MHSSERLISLDIFRGLTLAAMILVNNPGSWAHMYAPLKHAEWFGLTPTDLVYPFFIFIVGVAVKLSLDNYLLRAAPRAKLIGRILRRTFLLFALGLLLNMFANFDLSTLRIPGVLQRIAICYCAASFIYLASVRRVDKRVEASWKPFVLIIALLLGGYYLLMTFIPVPGHGAGQIASQDGNLAAYIDRLIFGAHLWQYSKTWDPEGILSTLPALATTLTGVLTGWWLKSQRPKDAIFKGMIFAGVVGTLVGFASSFMMPLCKKLWTPSFMLVTSGFALILLGLIYYYADIKKKSWGSRPFLVFGSNAITAYALSSLGAALMWKISLPIDGRLMSLNEIVYGHLFNPFLGDYFGSFMWSVFTVIVWWGIMSIFYKKRIFIKI
jgi:predicted acyltransferase